MSTHQGGEQYGPRPRHVAVIMDGNGRWARSHGRPRHYGHRAGAEAARAVIEVCVEEGVEALTLFAFSSENWRRPEREVRTLMALFRRALERERQRIHDNDICLRVVGQRDQFPQRLQDSMAAAEALTVGNSGLQLTVAAGYGGRWDITQASQRIASLVALGQLSPEAVDEAKVQEHLCLADLPEPDLFIRTGGQQRVSNFLLWQLAYTELYFTDVLWPDFGHEHCREAFRWFSSRPRRFGRTPDQLPGEPRHSHA